MNDVVRIENNEIVIDTKFIEKYRKFKKMQLEMEIAEKELKENLKNAMELTGKQHIILKGFSASIKDGYDRTSIDTTKLKKELPDIYEKYSKTTKVGSSITISVE
jgi:predicted phage-related endonuclease